MPTNPHDSLELLSKAELCSRLGFSVRTLENMVSGKHFPAGVQLGRQKYWSSAAVQAWVEHEFSAQHAWQPRSQAGRKK